MRRLFVPTAAPTTPGRAREAGDEYGESASPDWREIQWRAHLGRMEIDGTPVNYVDIGEGELEPIVFVHGLGGQWQNFLENIPRAAQERRVIALDLPGFGCTPDPAGRITISGYGHCVDALCEKLSLGRVDIVGNSMGGFVAAEVAIQFPQRIDQLILVSAAGITSADIARRPILTAGRIATAMVSYGAARHRN
ncbi:MAG TPA: alpha/beta fold hydrolase, partial [Thermoleophilaceae bacterium]|nr:alpha/beta fold hydrolase [Thermoleophilaceae bacterium]